MELRIVGSELELAEFLKALGTSKVIAKAVTVTDDKPKVGTKPKAKTKAKASSKHVDAKYLANKYGLTDQSIRSYARTGMPYQKIKGKLKFDEAEASAWIDKYIAEHPSKTRGMKYDMSKSKIKTESDYTKWKHRISEIARNSGLNEGKLLSATYKYMTKNYGIVWDQLGKDFYATNKRRATSTLELAYDFELKHPAYANLLEGCMDSVIKCM